ncbi:MAG: CaiB/BaiF CoA transferase family protein [Dehalococcoidia bacterium]
MVDGPFTGLRVVELGRFIAAPYCGQLLADGGADVIKVEDVTGDETRRNGPIVPGEGRQFLNKNRGKRSIAVDLGSADALAAVRSLAAAADIVVANFRPGRAEAIGLDYESLAATNTRLIYAENTAYGLEGPMAGAPGMDVVLAAYSGIAALTEHGPVLPEAPIIDYAAGLLLAWGVSTALYHRERTGTGQRLDVSLLQAALVLQNNAVNHVDVIDEWRPAFVEYLRQAFAEGKTWAEILEERLARSPFVVSRAYYGILRAADGALAVAALSRPLRLKVIALLGIDDRWVTEPGWQPPDARAHVESTVAAVEAALRRAPVSHWLGEFARIGVPAAPMRLREEMLDDPQVLANGFVTRLEHSLLGGHTVVSPPVRFSETPLRTGHASPRLGEHTRVLLSEAGLDAAAIESLLAQGAAVETI